MTRTQTYKYLIKTDASIKGTRSVHTYHIRGLKRDGTAGKVFRERGFGRLIDDSNLAEIYAMTEALQYMKEKGFKGAIVKTDSRDVVKMVKNRGYDYPDHRFGRDIVYLRKLLDATKSIIVFNKRDRNKGADYLCHLTWEKKQFSIKGKKVKGFRNTKTRNMKKKIRAQKRKIS